MEGCKWVRILSNFLIVVSSDAPSCNWILISFAAKSEELFLSYLMDVKTANKVFLKNKGVILIYMDLSIRINGTHK